MKKKQLKDRTFHFLTAFIFAIVFFSGMMLFPMPQTLFAGGSDMLIAAVSPTQQKTPAKTSASASPAKTYTEESVTKLFEGKGIGKKTLSAVCKENGIDVNLAKKKLAKQNIQMKADETLLDAAQKVSKSPIDVMKIILVGEPIKK